MTCYSPDTVASALVCRLSAVSVGPYRIEYLNDAGPYRWCESEHIGLLERSGNVVDIVTIGSEFFESIVEHYGADGVPERY